MGCADVRRVWKCRMAGSLSHWPCGGSWGIAPASHQSSSGHRRGLIATVSAARRSLEQALRRSRDIRKGLIALGRLSHGWPYDKQYLPSMGGDRKE